MLAATSPRGNGNPWSCHGNPAASSHELDATGLHHFGGLELEDIHAGRRHAAVRVAAIPHHPFWLCASSPALTATGSATAASHASCADTPYTTPEPLSRTRTAGAGGMDPALGGSSYSG